MGYYRFRFRGFLQTGALPIYLAERKIKRRQKTYAEKIMIIEENQETPVHFHLIFNRPLFSAR